jgi:flagellar basal-body rod protein FlgG
MNAGFYVGAIGLDAQQRALNVIANNIANINTTAFKRSDVRFSELVIQPQAGQPASTSLSPMAGVTVSAAPKVWTDGDLHVTGGPLDIAIDGAGFFEVLGPAGRSLLWRGGTMKVNDDGFLATSDGLPLRGMISVPRDATALSIAADGAVTAVGASGAERIGQIDVALARDTDRIAPFGNSYFEATDPGDIIAVKPGEEGGGVLVQGSLEAANVQLTDEMTSLLLVQRAYAANAQVVQTADQLMAIVNGLRR